MTKEKNHKIIGDHLGAGLNTEPRAVFKKCVSLTGKSDSLVTDEECRQHTTFNIQLCVAQDGSDRDFVK